MGVERKVVSWPAAPGMTVPGQPEVSMGLSGLFHKVHQTSSGNRVRFSKKLFHPTSVHSTLGSALDF